MSHYRFDCFTFDAGRLALFKRNQQLALRPKAALMLSTLLQAGGEVVGKRDLALAVWGTPHVSDQSLFQAVSELRRALAPLEAIVTHPNRGYAWAVKVRTRTARRWLQAATVAAIAVGAGLIVLLHQQHAAPAVATVQPLPALHALSNGMSSLQAARFAEAEHHFVLALAANPLMPEARLLLAETWLAQGDTTRARAMAAALLDSADTDGAYVGVAAMDLLSRSSTLDGTHDAALEWARSAADGARNSGFACAAAELEDRLARLVNGTRAREPGPAPRKSPVLAEVQLPQPAYCQQIHREIPDTGQLERHPAAPSRAGCIPASSEQSMA